jgi:signal peptidase I
VATRESEPSRSRKRGGWTDTLVIVVVAILLALGIQWLLVKPYRIPSPSMVPALSVGQRILVNRLSHRLGSDPKLGDVTVFTPPKGAETGACGLTGQGPFYDGATSRLSCSRATPGKANTTFVKRVVGLPGDTIEVRNGHVIRNGRAAKEPFASSCTEPECNLGAVTVPAGTFFMMGDNRGNSDDSRYWGPVPESWIIGKAFATYWPPKRIGIF